MLSFWLSFHSGTQVIYYSYTVKHLFHFFSQKHKMQQSKRNYFFKPTTQTEEERLIKDKPSHIDIHTNPLICFSFSSGTNSGQLLNSYMMTMVCCHSGLAKLVIFKLIEQTQSTLCFFFCFPLQPLRIIQGLEKRLLNYQKQLNPVKTDGHNQGLIFIKPNMDT